MSGYRTIYQIYVDAFARGRSGRSPGRKRGGDLEGVLEHLDYVAGLGADAIWLTPIFTAPSDHGYNITDYFRVDPRLAPVGPEGTAEALLASVVDRAHALGVAILLDLPLNHVGHGYDLETTPTSPPPRVRAARTRQERGWSRDLKYFDHDDATTRRFLFDVARFWIERFGVDGYRYDYVHGIANPFWEELYGELRGLRADLFVLGEHWDELGTPQENADDIASRFDGATGPCFDTLFDFPFQAAAVAAVASGDAKPLAETLDLCERAYPRPACAMLDNHDTARIADWADRDPRRIGIALRLLASRTGPISLLYGTETGLAAGQPPRKSVDESSRIPMDWSRAEDPLVDVCRRLLTARREHAVFAEGRTVARAAAGGLLAEIKQDAAGRRALVALNFAAALCLPGTAVPGAEAVTARLEAVCGAESVALDSGRLTTPIAPYGGGLYLLP